MSAPITMLDEKPPRACGPAVTGSGAATGGPGPEVEGQGARSLRRVLHNSACNLAVQGFQVTANLAVFLLLARSLGKEMLGEYYTLFALVMVLQLILEAGVGTALTQRAARAPVGWRAVAEEAADIFAVIVLVTLTVFAGLGAVWAWVAGERAVLLHCLAAGVACAGLQVQRYCEAVFQAFERFGCTNVARLLQAALYVAPVAVLIARGQARVGAVLAVFALSQVAAAVWLMTGLQRHSHCLSWRLPRPWRNPWLFESFALGVGDMVRGPNWHLDTILLGLLQPASTVGLYTVALRPNAPLVCLPRSVLAVLFPSFARMAVSNFDLLTRAFHQSIRFLWMIALPIAVAICGCAEPLITLLVGKEYVEAALPMRLLIWKTALSFISIQHRYLFAALGKQHTYARLVVLVLVLEAVVDLTLIPRWGCLGACAGCLLGEVTLTGVGFFLCRQVGVGRPDWRALLGTAWAGAVMGAVLWFARGVQGPGLLAAVVVSLVLYGIACVLFGAFQREEIRRLMAGMVRSFWGSTRGTRLRTEKVGV